MSFSFIHLKASRGSPPWQPCWSPSFEHESRTCGARFTSGKAPCLAILILSDNDEVAAWAQQDPQNRGMCWLRDWVRKFLVLKFDFLLMHSWSKWFRNSQLPSICVRHLSPVKLIRNINLFGVWQWSENSFELVSLRMDPQALVKFWSIGLNETYEEN